MGQFNPITGRELAEIILARLRQTLEQDQNFAKHLTYPVVAFEVDVKVVAYPREPKGFEAKVYAAGLDGELQKVIETRDRLRFALAQIEDLLKAISEKDPNAIAFIRVGDGLTIDNNNPPDKVRDSLGMPRKETTKLKSGEIIDAEVAPRKRSAPDGVSNAPAPKPVVEPVVKVKKPLVPSVAPAPVAKLPVSTGPAPVPPVKGEIAGIGGGLKVEVPSRDE